MFEIKRRLLYLGVGAAFFIITYSVGGASDISRGEVQNLREQFGQKIRDIDQNGIFINNLVISLGMFIPVAGIALGAFSGFSTGLIFNALAEGSSLLENVSPLVVLITPFGIMEVFAYGLAMSRSGMLIFQIVKKDLSKEVILLTIVEIGLVTGVLFLAAIVEWEMIMQYNADIDNIPV